MNAADSLRKWLTDRNLLPNYRIQFGMWRAGANTLDKYAVIRPVGGSASDLVRRPIISLTLIGAVNQPSNEVYELLNAVVDAANVDYCLDGIPMIEPGEPTLMQTEDGRPLAMVDIQFIQTLKTDL